MINMETSFWLQVFADLFLLFLFPLTIGRALRKEFSACFAYGMSCLLAAGAAYMLTTFMFGITDSGGRGWGGLVFLIILWGQIAVACVGGLMVLIAIIQAAASKTDERNEADET